MGFTSKELRILHILKDSIDMSNGVPTENLEQQSSAFFGDYKKTVLVLSREGLIQRNDRATEVEGEADTRFEITRDGLRSLRKMDSHN